MAIKIKAVHFLKLIGKIFVLSLVSLTGLAQAHVETIYPRSDTLPQNTLRLYIYFSEAMEEGVAVKHIHLVNDEGYEMKGVFLDMSTELWDPTGRRLTLLFDPGRVKTGLLAHQQLGGVLISGRHYKIVIDSLWKSKEGQSLGRSFLKKIYVNSSESAALLPEEWKINVPDKNKRQFVIDFGKTLDHASAIYSINIFNREDKKIQGTESLLPGERGYAFTPAKGWEKGNYYVRIARLLEDISGNNLDRAFEQVPDPAKSIVNDKFLYLPFQIK